MTRWDDAKSKPVDAVMKHLSVDVVYTCAGESADTFTAPFDEAYVSQGFDDEGLPVEASDPVIDVRLSDLTNAPRQEDTCTIQSRTFTVKHVEDGGQGLTAKLFLVETT